MNGRAYGVRSYAVLRKHERRGRSEERGAAPALHSSFLTCRCIHYPLLSPNDEDKIFLQRLLLWKDTRACFTAGQNASASMSGNRNEQVWDCSASIGTITDRYLRRVSLVSAALGALSIHKAQLTLNHHADDFLLHPVQLFDALAGLFTNDCAAAAALCVDRVNDEELLEHHFLFAGMLFALCSHSN